MKAKLGGTLYRDMGDKVKVMKVVRIFDDNGNLVKFTVIGVDVKKVNSKKLPHEIVKGREAMIRKKVKNILKKRGYEVIG